jgi:hypothetical protein
VCRACVAAVTELGQRAGDTLEIARRQIEQDEAAFLQKALREPFLDCPLALNQPVHGLVKLVLVGIRYTQINLQSSVGPGARLQFRALFLPNHAPL